MRRIFFSIVFASTWLMFSSVYSSSVNAEYQKTAITHYSKSGLAPTSTGNIIYFDDFSSYSPGLPPTGWTQRGSAPITPVVEEVGGTGPDYRLVSFPEVPWQYWDKWLIKDNLTLSSSYIVTVKLNFQNAVADRAGLTIAWDDSTGNHIDIQPNVYWDSIEFRPSPALMTSNTIIQSTGNIQINALTNYWLRAEVTEAAVGQGKVIVSWSTDNNTFTPIVTATGLANVYGQVGISTAGPHLPHVHFDDFKVIAGPSIETLADKAAALAKSLVSGQYSFGGKGWDYQIYNFVDTQSIFQGYWHTECATFNSAGNCTSWRTGSYPGLDCSGLVMWSYDKASGATNINDTQNPVYYQNAQGQFYENSQPISEADLKPGDLLFFYYGTPGLTIDHVAMYVGGDPASDVVQAANPNAGIIWSSKNHLKGLPQFRGFRRRTAPVVAFVAQTHSPVTLTVTDPDGFSINANTQIVTRFEVLHEVPNALYYIVGANQDDSVAAPTLKTGAYLIQVVPKTGAAPTDTYSLDVEAAGTHVTLAQNVPIGSIPSHGYGLVSTGSQVSQSTVISVDVKPGEDPPAINPNSQGVIPVAILSTPTFDATTVKPSSVKFGPNGLSALHSSTEDVNGDSLPDLILQFKTHQVGITAGETQACLMATTTSGANIVGCDAIRVVP